jgi:hypothetical protein
VWVGGRKILPVFVEFNSGREQNVQKSSFDFMISELTEECKRMHITLAAFVLFL